MRSLPSGEDSQYENFCHSIRPVFDLENWVLDIVTIFGSLMVVLYAIMFMPRNFYAFILSGLAGVILSVAVKRQYNKRAQSINEDVKRLKAV